MEVYFIPRSVVKHPATYIGTHAAFHKKKLKLETFPQIEVQDDRVVFVVSGLKVDRSIAKRENLFGSVVRMMPIASVLKIDRDSTWRSALQGKGNLTEVQSRWWTTFWNCSVLYTNRENK